MRIEDAAAFRDAAVADGWTIKPTYDHEPQHSAATLSRDGWHMSVLTRSDPEFLVAGNPYGAVSLWGPDKMHIETPGSYSMETLEKGLRKCGYCARKDVDTFQVAFASRVCAVCLPEQKRIHPGVDVCNQQLVLMREEGVMKRETKAMKFERVARMRGLPHARIGDNVRVDGKTGVVVGANDSAKFDVKFEDGHVGNCHPGWRFEFL